MKIWWISRTPADRRFDKFTPGESPILKRMQLKGHQVHSYCIEPVRVPNVYVSYALAILRFPFRFRGSRPDVIVTNCIESAVACVMMKWLFNVPFVFHFIDDYSLIASYSRRRLKDMRVALLRMLERCIPVLADLVIVVSDELKKFCLDAGVPEGKVRMVENGVDTELFKPGGGHESIRDRLGLSGGKVILFRGKLNRYYRIELIIRAIPMVLREFPNTKLLLIGDGDNVDKLKLLSRELGIVDSLLFVEFQPQEKLSQYINVSDICVYPLSNSGALAMLEYASCAKPTILPRVGTRKLGPSHELIRRNCVLLVENSPEGFAKGMKFLLRNEERAEEMGRKARKIVVKSYDLNILASQYERALQQVLK